MMHPDGFFSEDKGATAVTVCVANPEEEHRKDFILSYKPHATNANTLLTAETDWTDMKGIRISPYQSVLKCIHTILFRMAGKTDESLVLLFRR